MANDYGARVYRLSGLTASRLQRALHAELCRPGEQGLHSSTGMPACMRALEVVREAQDCGELPEALYVGRG